MPIARDLELLYEIGSLRNLPRTWKQMLGVDVADNLAHTVRVMTLALLIARMEGVKSEEKILKMALIHDFAEARTGDGHYVHKVYVDYDEERALDDMFRETLLSDLREGVLREYKERKTIEARIVKDADNLDVDLEIKELEERGHREPEKWAKFRRQVRNEKLYTKSARRLWDAIQKSDPSSWHLTTNKWLKIKTAGK